MQFQAQRDNGCYWSCGVWQNNASAFIAGGDESTSSCHSMRSSSVDLISQVLQGSIGIVSSAVGYSADDGCVAPATIKENIIFGRYRLTCEEAFALSSRSLKLRYDAL
jgi:hypothetical protein